MRHMIYAISASLAVAACSSGGTDTSQTTLLNDDGTFVTPLTDPRGSIVRQTGTENGYAFQVGYNEDRTGFETQAAMFDVDTLAAPTSGGSADMTGFYQLEALVSPVMIDGDLSGTRLTRPARAITLTVDFENNAVSGADGGLVLDGQFTSTGQLDGTASFQGMTGDLSGVVSDADAIGVFEGKNETGVFAGGLIVAR